MSTKPAEVLHLDGHDVGITRPEKVLFPDDAITKGDLIRYYQRISRWMLPHLSRRPLALQRYPDGIDQPGFFQKAAGRYYPDWIHKATLPKTGGTVRHVLCDDAATLVYLANQACVTLHTWLSQVDEPRLPDRLIFDIDPSTGDFASVIDAAHALKEVLDELRLPAYLKATGSRGLHIVVPILRKEDFDEVRAFARQVAGIVVKRDPGRYTMEQYKNKRHGRLFLDTNRNAYAQTSVALYSVRARKGAPVSVPLGWAELSNRNLRSDGITIRSIFERLETVENPWKDFWRHAPSLEKARQKLARLHAA